MPVLEVKQNKRINNKFAPVRVCVITYKGQHIPDKVSIYAVKCRVSIYRLGYVASQCRAL